MPEKFKAVSALFDQTAFEVKTSDQKIDKASLLQKIFVIKMEIADKKSWAPEQDSIQNGSERIWNKEMRSLIQEMIHYRNELDPEEECSPEKTRSLKAATEPYFKKQRRNMKRFQQVIITGTDISCTCGWKSIWKPPCCSCMNAGGPATNNEAGAIKGSNSRPCHTGVSKTPITSVNA